LKVDLQAPFRPTVVRLVKAKLGRSGTYTVPAVRAAALERLGVVTVVEEAPVGRGRGKRQ